MKLISMTDFVLEQKQKNCQIDSKITDHYFNNIVDYANFLKQPLELWMFVTCDEIGSVLEEPKHYSSFIVNEETLFLTKDEINLIYKYQQAKERVLFDVYLAYIHSDDSGLFVQHELFGDGFYITADGETTIEYLLEFTETLELTTNAIKQLGL